MVRNAQEHSAAIDLNDVHKQYRGKIYALQGVDLKVDRGEVFGLLGPNGAGKSTLVKIMMTVVRPTKATGLILGDPVGTKSTLKRVGYLPEHHRIPQYLTGQQVMDLYGGLLGVDRKTRQSRAGELLDIVGMLEWRSKRVGSYSKGMQQRLGLAQALINDPDLIVLDEPTDGVDPVGRRDIRDILVRLKDQGKTVFLNSHLLSELEMVCDRVSILVQGKVAMEGTIDDLTKDSQRYEVIIEGEAPGWLGDESNIGVEDIGSGMCKLWITGNDPKAMQPILDRLRNDNRLIRRLQPVRENLEDLFMRAVTNPETGETRKPGAGASTMKKGASA